ncbi:MAG: deoxyribose-phosphate aldolase [Bacteroidales bacterium]|nr:deoxyribose-phosphate aldolase [Bacteroidales bacterium]
MNFNYSTSQNFDMEQAEKKALDMVKEARNGIDEQDALRALLGMIDLTTLEGKDTDERVSSLCEQGSSYADEANNIPAVAAICVYPTFISLAKEKLIDTPIAVASVAGAFPAGQSPIHVKAMEVKYAAQMGADDIDIVISRGIMLEEQYDIVLDELKQLRSAAEDKHLKVILETGELSDYTLIQKASELAINAGADFIKTSTGKVKPAATLGATMGMCEVIKAHYERTGEMIGIKPAGGISEPEDALDYYVLIKHLLGDKWLNKKYFRIGASRLANKIYESLAK